MYFPGRYRSFSISPNPRARSCRFSPFAVVGESSRPESPNAKLRDGAPPVADQLPEPVSARSAVESQKGRSRTDSLQTGVVLTRSNIARYIPERRRAIGR